MFPFEKILTYIANEQCALVVGPEIMQFEGKPMNMYLRDKLHKQYEGDVTYYYQNDGLFLFRSDDPSVKSDVALSLRKECNLLPGTPGFDENILKAVAQLPFHLIVSINPDTFLSDTFYKYGVRHRFSHFRKGPRPSDEVAPPTREEPLIYNIAGSVLEDESLILDYDDLFSLIGSTLGASTLPTGLLTALGSIRTFIFLGFNFEKWHTQILLRILSGKPADQKYAGPHKLTPDTHTFLDKQFKIVFWDVNNGDFLTTFLQAATDFKDTDPKNANRTFMRPLLEDPLAPEETNIIREIQNARFDKAIARLLDFAKGKAGLEDQAVHLSSRYQHLTKNQTGIDSSAQLTTLNQITDTAITLARQIASTP